LKMKMTTTQPNLDFIKFDFKLRNNEEQKILSNLS
jgi:hypothetical protein